MAKLAKKHSVATGFTSSNPDGGYFWRGLLADEVSIYEDPSEEYGLPAANMDGSNDGLSELNGMPSMKDKRCARFFSEKAKAVGWTRGKAGAKVIRVPKDQLTRSVDYDVWPKTDDAYITGDAARNHGETFEPDQVPTGDHHAAP
jgi:hypothetical protein